MSGSFHIIRYIYYWYTVAVYFNPAELSIPLTLVTVLSCADFRPGRRQPNPLPQTLPLGGLFQLRSHACRDCAQGPRSADPDLDLDVCRADGARLGDLPGPGRFGHIVLPCPSLDALCTLGELRMRF